MRYVAMVLSVLGVIVAGLGFVVLERMASARLWAGSVLVPVIVLTIREN